MLNKEIILTFLQNNFSYFQSNYHITKIGIIGSFARDEQREESDIDLLIEFEPGTQNIFELKFKLKEFLKKKLNRDVDICREKYLKPYVKEYIIKEVIYV